MGVFNNFGEYNAEDEAARRAELMKIFHKSNDIDADYAELETRVITALEKPIVKIEKTFCNGTSYSVICPNCGKIKFLSSELNSMRAVCNKCYCVFNLKN